MTDPDDVTPALYVETAEADPSAAALYGQQAVDEAVSELTMFAAAEAFPPALLDPEQREFTTEDLADQGFIDRLTPEAAEAWQALVGTALEGDADAQDGVRLMRFYDVDEPAWTLPEEAPVVANQQITNVLVDVDTTAGAGQELLVVSFDHGATLAFLEDGQSVTVHVEKEMTYRLTPATAQEGPSWLVASFDGEYEVLEEQ